MKNDPVYNIYSCDLCDNDKPVEIECTKLYTDGNPIHVCGNCGFVYVRKRRSSNEIARMWSEEIYGDIYTAVNNPAMISRQTFVTRFLLNEVNINNKTICDIGAGEGLFLKQVLSFKKAKDVFGIEPSKKNCKLLKDQNISHFNGTIEEYLNNKEYKDKKFDIVSIMWTLENCLSCIDMLRGAYDILNENGKIIVATGSRILVPFKKPLFLYLSKNPLDSHSFRFSFNSLKTALAKTSFETIKHNRYIDNDILCIIAQKKERNKEIVFENDNPNKVLDFFNRWHQDTLNYLDHKV